MVLLYATAAASVVLAAWWLILATASTRVLVRAGAWPLCSSSDLVLRPDKNYPDTLKAYLKKTMIAFGRPPTVIGRAWSFYVQRAGPREPRLFTHTFEARLGERTWLSGTTVAQVQRELRPLTLTCHPSLDDITIGAWFVTSAHGNQGDATPGNSQLFQSADVVDMRTGATQAVSSYPELRRMFDGPEGAAYVVMSVTIARDAVVEDGWLQKRGFVIDSPLVAAEWLLPRAYLRILMVGAARTGAIGLRWTSVYDQEQDHVDPHDCSRYCTLIQTDVCAAMGGCHETMLAWTGKTRRSDAIAWIPPLPGVFTLTALCGGISNFEAFFRMPSPMTGNTLFRLIQELGAMHARCGGRTELRFASQADFDVVYLDFSMAAKFAGDAFRLLRQGFGVERIALHPGKHTRVSTLPCQRVTVSEIFGFDASSTVVV
jgi:hypothetical protein